MTDGAGDLLCLIWIRTQGSAPADDLPRRETKKKHTRLLSRVKVSYCFCEQARLKSSCESAQSNRSVFLSHIQSIVLGTLNVKIDIPDRSFADAQADLNCCGRLMATLSHCVMVIHYKQMIYKYIYRCSIVLFCLMVSHFSLIEPFSLVTPQS